jgi:hypothetical protein
VIQNRLLHLVRSWDFLILQEFDGKDIADPCEGFVFKHAEK